MGALQLGNGKVVVEEEEKGGEEEEEDGGEEGQWQVMEQGREGWREVDTRHTPPSTFPCCQQEEGGREEREEEAEAEEEEEEEDGRWGGFRDGDEVFVHFDGREGRLTMATWREGGREALFRFPLPRRSLPGGGEDGREGGGEGWFLCAYLSNGVGVDLLPATGEAVRRVVG
jgi:hypothetical protein